MHRRFSWNPSRVCSIRSTRTRTTSPTTSPWTDHRGGFVSTNQNNKPTHTQSFATNNNNNTQQPRQFLLGETKATMTTKTTEQSTSTNTNTNTNTSEATQQEFHSVHLNPTLEEKPTDEMTTEELDQELEKVGWVCCGLETNFFIPFSTSTSSVCVGEG